VEIDSTVEIVAEDGLKASSRRMRKVRTISWVGRAGLDADRIVLLGTVVVELMACNPINILTPLQGVWESLFLWQAIATPTKTCGEKSAPALDTPFFLWASNSDAHEKSVGRRVRGHSIPPPTFGRFGVLFDDIFLPKDIVDNSIGHLLAITIGVGTDTTSL